MLTLYIVFHVTIDNIFIVLSKTNTLLFSRPLGREQIHLFSVYSAASVRDILYFNNLYPDCVLLCVQLHVFRLLVKKIYCRNFLDEGKSTFLTFTIFITDSVGCFLSLICLLYEFVNRIVL
jgi:hypothetical protein